MYTFDFWFEYLLLQCSDIEKEVIYESRETLLSNWKLLVEQDNDEGDFL